MVGAPVACIAVQWKPVGPSARGGGPRRPGGSEGLRLPDSVARRPVPVLSRGRGVPRASTAGAGWVSQRPWDDGAVRKTNG